MMRTATKYLATFCLLLGSPYVAAEDLRNANYEVSVGDFNSDGAVDLLLPPKGQLVLISLDDLLLPIFAKSAFATTVISSLANGQYAVDTSAQESAINQTQWTAGGYEVVSADCNGDGSNELFLRSTTPGGTSFVLTSTTGTGTPVLKQQLNPADFGLDFGAPNTSISLEDRNGDGRTDIVVTQAGMILAILLANSDGTFASIGDKTDDSDATIKAIWTGFGTRLNNGEASKALEYFSIPRQADYDRIFAVLGDGIRDLTSHWTQAAPLIVDKDYAEYAVTQTINGQTRMHIIGFMRDSDGQWRIDQL